MVGIIILQVEMKTIYGFSSRKFYCHLADLTVIKLLFQMFH